MKEKILLDYLTIFILIYDCTAVYFIILPFSKNPGLGKAQLVETEIRGYPERGDYSLERGKRTPTNLLDILLRFFLF